LIQLHFDDYVNSIMSREIAVATPELKKPTYLFKLPDEIRNKIYEYALSSTHLFLRMPFDDQQAVSADPTRLKRPILQSRQTDSPDVEYNQLKFVCRQAYAETAGLELKYNGLIVCDRSRDDEAVGLQFVKFLENIGAAKHSWLHGCLIDLVDGRENENRPGHTFLPDSAATVARIASFCNANPSVSVHYIIPSFDALVKPHKPVICPITFMSTGIYYAHFLRNRKNDSMLQFAPNVNGEDWTRNIDIQTLQAPNLRFRPVDDTLDEAEFRRFLNQQPIPEEAVNRLLVYARRLVGRGL
jgi:hypothetical protein